MARTMLGDAVGLVAADVSHKRFTALPHSATIGDVRDWFAASSHRRVAFLVEDEHYVGSLTRALRSTPAAQDVLAMRPPYLPHPA